MADAGWYEDPLERHDRRYWDGGAWTAFVRDAGRPGHDPFDAPSPASQPSILARDIAVLMERYGRHDIDVTRSADDAADVFAATQQPLLQLALDGPERLVSELSERCAPVGGWAAYGAERTIVNLIGVPTPSAAWLRLLDASMAFLRENDVPPMRVPPYMWSHFLHTGGSANTWIPLRPPPDRATTRVAPLLDGEERPVVKLGPEPDANVVVVVRDGNVHRALVDSRQSDDDPTRVRTEWKEAVDLYDLYLDIAWTAQIWHSADAELEPFFPAPRARI